MAILSKPSRCLTSCDLRKSKARIPSSCQKWTSHYNKTTVFILIAFAMTLAIDLMLFYYRMSNYSILMNIKNRYSCVVEKFYYVCKITNSKFQYNQIKHSLGTCDDCGTYICVDLKLYQYNQKKLVKLYPRLPIFISDLQCQF